MTTYQEWASTVPSEITADPLWHMEVYRIALFLGEICWSDVRTLLKLVPEFRGRKIAEEIAHYEVHPLEFLLENIPSPTNETRYTFHA